MRGGQKSAMIDDGRTNISIGLCQFFLHTSGSGPFKFRASYNVLYGVYALNQWITLRAARTSTLGVIAELSAARPWRASRAREQKSGYQRLEVQRRILNVCQSTNMRCREKYAHRLQTDINGKSKRSNGPNSDVIHVIM